MSFKTNSVAQREATLVSKSAHITTPARASLLSLTHSLRWEKGLLASLLLAALLGLLFFPLRFDVEPYVLVLGLIAATAAMVAARKFLPALIAGLLYVGNFKTTAAVGLSFTDPTFVVLMLCSAGLLIECLFIFSGTERLSISSLFAGQGRGVLLFVLFVLMIAASDFYTAAPESGLMKLERIAAFCTLAFFAPFILFKREKDLRQFLITCVVLSLALSVRNLVQLFHPTPGVLSGNQDITRIGDGELIATTIVILIYHRLFRDRRKLQLICISLLAIGLAASAARSAALSLLVIVALTSVFLRSGEGPFPRRKILLGVFLAASVAAATVIWIQHLPAARSKFEHKEDELSQLIRGSFLPGGTAEQRMTFYKQSLVAIGEKPVLGWGVGGWGAFFLGVDTKAIPHNFILESAVEQGLLGCGILVALLMTAGSALPTIVRRSGSHFAFLMPAFLLSVLLNLVTGDLESRLLWFWCGTIFAVCRILQHPIQQPRTRAGAGRY